MWATNWAWARSYPLRSSSCWVSASSATPPRCGAGCSGHDRAGDDAEPSDEEERRYDAGEVDMSQDPAERAADESRDAPTRHGHAEAEPKGRHELPPHTPRPEIGSVHRTGLAGLLEGGRSRLVFGLLATLLCLVLGIAIVTQVRQTKSGDSLDTARPADLLVLLDSLRQREATLNTEVGELQNTLNSLQASGNSDQAAIQSAQAKLA